MRRSKEPTVVLHEAALPSVARSTIDPRLTADINVNGTIEVMLAAARAGVRRVVLAGSSSVYGSSEVLPRREDQAPDPRSPYATSKLAAELMVHQLGELHGIETVVLRYFNIYGAGQDPNSEYSAVVPRFITAALRGEPPVIHGDGHQSRDFTHIDNVVFANLRAAEAAGASGLTANIGCGGRYSLLDLLDAIRARLPDLPEPVFEATQARRRPPLAGGRRTRGRASRLSRRDAVRGRASNAPSSGTRRTRPASPDPDASRQAWMTMAPIPVADFA